MDLTFSNKEFLTPEEWDRMTKKVGADSPTVFKEAGIKPMVVWHSMKRKGFVVPNEQSSLIEGKLTWTWLDKNCKHKYFIWNRHTIAFDDFDDCLIFALRWL